MKIWNLSQMEDWSIATARLLGFKKAVRDRDGEDDRFSNTSLSDLLLKSTIPLPRLFHQRVCAGDCLSQFHGLRYFYDPYPRSSPQVMNTWLVPRSCENMLHSDHSFLFSKCWCSFEFNRYKKSSSSKSQSLPTLQKLIWLASTCFPIAAFKHKGSTADDESSSPKQFRSFSISGRICKQRLIVTFVFRNCFVN